MATPKATRGEVALLVGIVILAAVSFSPLIDGITIAGVGLIAWLLWFIMLAAPAAGLIAALRSRED